MILRNNNIEPEEFINLLSNQEIIIYEEVQGSKIWCNFVNGNWVLRPKNINQNPINLIDLATQKYYKWAWAYLLSLESDVTDLLRPNQYFCFEYFPDEQPANIKYERLPKNGLILTCICKYGKKFSYDIAELKSYANLFDVETLPIIYKGVLSDKQLKAITFFLNTNSRDLELFFKESNFAEFFYKILNPFTNNSYLKTKGFQNNLEKIIIRYVNSNIESTLEILNPLYQRMELKTDSEYSEVYSILLFNFMQWLLTIDLDNVKVDGTTREIAYINLICELFNQYLEKYENNILNFVFAVPQFFNSDKFKINTNLIKNTKTIDNINKSQKLEYVLKILLSSFKKSHKKSIGIINDIALEHLNTLSRKIQVRVEEQFNYNQKISNFSKVTNIADYKNIKWQEDHKGYITTEIDSVFTDNNSNKKKLDKKK